MTLTNRPPAGENCLDRFVMRAGFVYKGKEPPKLYTRTALFLNGCHLIRFFNRKIELRGCFI